MTDSTTPAQDVTTELEALRAQVNELHEDRERVRAELEHIETTISDMRADLLDAMRPPVNDEEAHFRRLARHMHHAVRASIPRGATIAVASGGDETLVRFFGRVGWHFPRRADGGHEPSFPDVAVSSIAHLESLRAQGAQFFAVPGQWRSRLHQQTELARHLATRYELVIDEEACVAYDLRRVLVEPADGERHLELACARFHALWGRPAVLLDLRPKGTRAEPQDGKTVFVPTDGETSAYLDKSIDVVVVLHDDEVALAEAHRLASAAVVALPADGDDTLPTTEWKSQQAAGPPSVSIVIPVHNGLKHTRACIATLAETLSPDIGAEIIVVDDASTDQTQAWLSEAAAADPRIKVVRNDENLGFLGSTSVGARQATGDLIIFLNNDTVLLPGWLEPLVQVFMTEPDAGVVGARLLYPDGRLQEAGGLVFEDGSAAKFGYGDDDPEHVLYGNLRDADYVSGCLLVTPRALYEEIGGFDQRFEPGYYEDTDYCFMVRSRGKRVIYQPASTVVHVEGGTAGTDLSEGMKRFQALNEVQFREKWATSLARQPTRPASVLTRDHLFALRGRSPKPEAVS